MSAPEKIWAWQYSDKDGNPDNAGEWYTQEVGLDGDETEYTRSATIPAMLAEARRDALREVLKAAEVHHDKNWSPSLECIVLDLLDAEAPAQPKPDAGQDTCPRCGAAGGFGCYECTPDAGKATP